MGGWFYRLSIGGSDVDEFMLFGVYNNRVIALRFVDVHDAV